MDRRALFLIVYAFTLISTLLVAFITFHSGHSWMIIILYTVSTMWIVGVISQLLMHYIYLSIIRPIEEEKYQAQVKEEMQHQIPIDEVEKIDDIAEGKLVKKLTPEEKPPKNPPDESNTQT